MSDYNKLDVKLDKIVDIQIKQEITLTRLTDSVEHHIKRTDALEERFIPVQEHVNDLKAVIKILKTMGIFTTLVVSILEIIRWFK